MELRHILAATDESDAGRRAVHAAVELARLANARVTVIRAIPAGVSPVPVGVEVAIQAEPEPATPALERLQRWLEADGIDVSGPGRAELAVSYGVPSIEVCRFAEHYDAGLVVLGRKPRSAMARMLVGDTADSVARRSRVPCLFVPPRGVNWRRVVVAVDGTDRGMSVLLGAADFCRVIGAELRAVTVEPWRHDEAAELAATIPSTRATQLRARVERAGANLEIRQGDPVEQILAVAAVEADVLVVGYHRGGPPGILDAGSTARRLVHTAPCAVMTIPL